MLLSPALGGGPTYRVPLKSIKAVNPHKPIPGASQRIKSTSVNLLVKALK